MQSRKLSSRFRLGVVSFLNARPLIEGLEGPNSGIDLVFDVPSRLGELLDAELVDAALTPVIDLVRPGRAWNIISDACIGCDGETLTVRVFSRVPAAAIRRLHADGDSRTSVVLARVIWRELYGTELAVLPFEPAAESSEREAVLLIGDKVINPHLPDLDLEIDLGGAWKSLTGLPFVFAVWAARRGRDLGGLADRLEEARDRGVARAAEIAEHAGPGMGWPVELAKRYLVRRLVFTLSERHREGLGLFLDLAKKHGLVPDPPDLVYA